MSARSRYLLSSSRIVLLRSRSSLLRCGQGQKVFVRAAYVMGIRPVMRIHLLLDRVGRLLTRRHLHLDLRQLDATPLERAMRHVDLLPKVIQLQIRRRRLGPYRKHLPRETYPALHISTVRRGGDGASARHTPRARIQTLRATSRRDLASRFSAGASTASGTAHPTTNGTVVIEKMAQNVF